MRSHGHDHCCWFLQGGSEGTFSLNPLNRILSREGLNSMIQFSFDSQVTVTGNGSNDWELCMFRAVRLKTFKENETDEELKIFCLIDLLFII